MPRIFTEDVSSPMAYEEETTPRAMAWKRPKRGYWALNLTKKLGESVILLGPVTATDFYYCPKCFATHIRVGEKCRGRGKGKITVEPISRELLPPEMMVKLDMEWAKMYSKHCQCYENLVKIPNQEVLGEIFDLLKLQLERFEE